MKLDNTKTLIGLLGLVVVASGCTNTSGGTSVTTTQTQGITVNEFSTFPASSVIENSQVQLTMGVQNTGGAVAQNVEAQVFNVPFGQDTNQAWSGDPPSFTFGELQPPDTENNIPATPATQTKTVTAPNFDQRISVPYTFRAKLDYDYSTTAQTEIVLMGQERFRSTQGSTSQPQVENTGGPIQMEVRTRSPIVFYSGSQTQPRFCVIATNEGGGTAYLPGTDPSESSNLDKVEINPTSSQFSLSAPSSDSNGNQVSLVGGRGVQCFDIDDTSNPGSNSQLTVPVTLTANYGYQKEVSDSITVEGRSN
jgi:hypothetical protein